MLHNSFKIGKNPIGEGRTFIIAEIGSNHNQNMDTAKKLIDVAVDSGVDAVKFQSIKYDELYRKNDNSEMENLFEQIQLKEEWHEKLSDYCDKKGIIFSSSPTYLGVVDILEKVDIKLYKIASPQTATFPQLIEKIAMLKKPIIMSTGYCTLDEIDRAVKIVERSGNEQLALLHCVSEYPTKPEMANIKFIQTLKQIYNIPIGFSDHTLGLEVTIAAVAMGADVIEKHITLSRDQKGPDHFFALEPLELKRMVESIRTIERSIGDGIKLKIEKNEIEMLNNIKMGGIAKHDLFEGQILDKKEDILLRRNCNGMDAWSIYKAQYMIARRNIKKGEMLSNECIEIQDENN